MVLIGTTNLRPVRADIHFAQGKMHAEHDQLDQSIASYRRALELAPRQDHYYSFLGEAYIRKALAEQELSWFAEAEESLSKATDLSRLRPDHEANLGLLYYYWGRVTPDPAEAAERLRTSLAYYDRATSISPYTQGRILEDNRFKAHLELAEVYEAMGQFDRAIKEARAARDLAASEQESALEELIDRLRARDVGYWADVEADCRVGMADIQAVANHWRCEGGSNCYDARFDRDEDGSVTVVDIMRVVAEWGWTCP
jgi:tetratricopeptide (TPR) repeat protein